MTEEATKDWVGHVSIPIRSEIDGPIIGHVVELYPGGTGKCIMLDGTVDTMKLFHGAASLGMVPTDKHAIEYRMLVGDSVPTITVEDTPGETPTPYDGRKYRLVSEACT